MKKILLIFFSFLFAVSARAGNNLSITCTSLSCTKSSALQLFNEVNISPGFSQSQTLRVINQRSDNCNLFFKLNQSSLLNPLSSVQMISIFEEETLWYGGSFNDLSDNKNHTLGNIDSNQYKDFVWTSSLNQSLGNDYQLLNNIYDLDFNFTCGEQTSDTYLCRDIAPRQIPQNLIATAGLNSVTLSWDETEDYFSYYLISYSTESHGATHAIANIGGKGTKSYKIDNLLSGLTYYFKIRTGNGCAPGPFSTIVSVTLGGQTLINPSFSTLSPDVLGEQNIFNSIPPSSPAERNKCFNIFPYAFLLALLINIIFNRYYLFTFFISLLSFIFDYYLNQYLCRNYHYFYLNNLISFILPLFFSLKKPKT